MYRYDVYVDGQIARIVADSMNIGAMNELVFYLGGSKVAVFPGWDGYVNVTLMFYAETEEEKDNA